jgi:hypothetical protein
MAHYAEMSLDDEIYIQANIDDTVGFGGRNNRLDVIMIQSLFKELDYKIKQLEGRLDDFIEQKSDVDGIWKRDDDSKLEFYQKTRRGGLLMKRHDGLIHQASYHGRKLHRFREAMIITALSFQAFHIPLRNVQPAIRLCRWSPELMSLPLVKWDSAKAKPRRNEEYLKVIMRDL